jgi:hypothetical protein
MTEVALLSSGAAGLFRPCGCEDYFLTFYLITCHSSELIEVFLQQLFFTFASLSTSIYFVVVLATSIYCKV